MPKIPICVYFGGHGNKKFLGYFMAVWNIL
jgi:hypothetical protein